MPTSSETSTGTRQRLLQTSLMAFGAHDFDAVSTREIVEAAGANISAISYHFGGKKGLYLATAEYLAENLYAGLEEDFSRIHSSIDATDSSQYRQALGELVGHFCRQLLTGKFGEHAPGFIFREHNQPSEAFDILYEKLFQPMHDMLTTLVAGAKGLSPSSEQARMIAHALLGQAIVVRSARTTLLRHLSKSTYSADDIQLIQNLVSTMTSAALAGGD